jgi:hypothetical protein
LYNESIIPMKSLKIILPAMAVAMIALTSCSGGNAGGLDKTPKIGSAVFFADSQAPSGWAAKAGYTNNGLKALVAKQNPVALSKGDCSYTQQVTYLADYYKGRTDDYLTRQYIYDNAQIAGILPHDLKSVKISTDSGDLEMLSTSYEVKGSAVGNSKDAKTPDSFRTLAVRVLDNSLSTGYDVPAGQKGPYDSDVTKGLPVVVLTEECKTQGDFVQSDWDSLIKSTKVNLNQTAPSDPSPSAKPSVSPSEPAQPSAKETASPSATDTASSSSTESGTPSSSATSAKH